MNNFSFNIKLTEFETVRKGETSVKHGGNDPTRGPKLKTVENNFFEIKCLAFDNQDLCQFALVNRLHSNAPVLTINVGISS